MTMKPKTKKTLVILGSVLGAIVLLLVLLALLLISPPANYVYMPDQAEADSLLVAEIVDMISDSVVDDEGNIPEIAEVSIPAEHVRALLRQVAYHINLKMKDDGVACSLDWRDGALAAECSYPLPESKAVILRGAAVPTLKYGVFTLKTVRLSAGRLPLPSSIRIVKDGITEESFKDEEARQAFSTVHHLEPADDGGLRLGVYPERISSLIRLLVSGD